MNADQITRGQRVQLASAPEIGVYIVTPWHDEPVTTDTGEVRLVRDDAPHKTGPAVWRYASELQPAPDPRPEGDEWIGQAVSYLTPKGRRLSTTVLAVVKFQGLETLITDVVGTTDTMGMDALHAVRAHEVELSE